MVKLFCYAISTSSPEHFFFWKIAFCLPLIAKRCTGDEFDATLSKKSNMLKCVRNFNWWLCRLIGLTGLMRLIADLFVFVDWIDLLLVHMGVFLNFTENRYCHCVKRVQIQTKKNSLFGHFRHCVNKVLVKSTWTRSRSSFLNLIFKTYKKMFISGPYFE